ncbi:unnamed protein product [Enterobius vermicularis]|uniref:CPG4 domain-containing protein n=1 Tax=Enterobius vermicularis TaxID=51028 RepID=A0A0N4V6E6_ENTVE|nr:unnamed protein product [Enterobius vermicularis]
MYSCLKPRLPESVATSESCVGQCAFDFASSLRSQLEGTDSATLLNLNYNELLIAFSNATFLKGFCRIYHVFQHCYASCPHGYMLELLARSSTVIDHFCVYYYKEIQAKFGCLAKLNRAVSKQCLQHCTPHHRAVNSLMHNFRHLALSGDSSDAERYLNESCEYVICSMHCDLPVIAHMCSLDTANLVLNVTRKAFGSMHHMALDTGAISK